MPDVALDTAKLELLHEHYRDSCQAALDTRRIRDRACLWTLLCTLTVLFERSAPGEFGSFIAGLIAKQSEGARLDLQYVSTFVWVGALGFTIRHFQAAVRLDREYRYLQSLEKHLASAFPAPSFTREGAAYLRDYPAFSNWVHVLYSVVLPIGLLLIALSRIVQVCAVTTKPPRLWADLAISVLLVVTILLYLWTQHLHGLAVRLRRSLTRR